MTMGEYQHRDTWASMNNNIVTYKQMRISRWESINKCKYQCRDTWSSENIKSGCKSKCEYKHFDTWPSVNMGTHNEVKLLTRRYITTCDYKEEGTWTTWNINMVASDQERIEHRETKPHVSINMWIRDQVWVSTLWYLNKCEYFHGDTRPSVNINKRKHDHVQNQHWYTWPHVNINKEIHYKVGISSWG